MRKATATIALILFFAANYAQDNILLIGYVRDKDAKEGLALAAVQVKNTQLGALTEDDGFFALPIPKSNLKDSLRISFIGYRPTSISAAKFQNGDTLKIFLETEVQTKPETEIVAMNAKGVLRKAIENMKKNFHFDSLIANGFYRQYHKENGKYVRLIESDVDVAFNARSPYQYQFHELVKVNKIRRSENYETNGENHGDHLVDLLKENPWSYNKGNFLNVKNLDFYAPKFVTDSETNLQYVISVQYKETSSEKLEKAMIWVEKETYAITRMEVEKFPNPYYVKSRYAGNSRWKLVNEKDVVETEKVNGKYQVSSIRRSYNHHVLNTQTGNVDYVVEEDFELYFEDYETDDVSSIIAKGGYSYDTDLYKTKYKYDEKFWNDYGGIIDYELPEAIQKDLEHNKPLKEQFRLTGANP